MLAFLFDFCTKYKLQINRGEMMMVSRVDDRAFGGTVAPGFEAVRSAFEANFDPVLPCPEVGAAFTVFHRGELVVDLWGGFTDKRCQTPWTRDTLVNTYSTSKGIASACTTLLESRGQLEYGKPVAYYWPEFATGSKGGLAVDTLLSHRAGLSGLRTPLELTDLFDHEKMASLLAAAEPLWTPGSMAGYHALTWGPLVAELVKRITGQTIGQFLAREIAQPLDAAYFFGLTPEQPIADIIAPPGEAHQSQAELSEILKLTLMNPIIEPTVANRADFRAAELPALGGAGSANGIARIYAALLGSDLFPADAFKRAARVRFDGIDMNTGAPARWGAGFFGNTVRRWYGPHMAAAGHSGWGGSMGYADPVDQLAVGYVVNQMDTQLNGDPRGLRLVAALYQCLHPQR
jgi:CubicO group peptidase (beta-lactamase class C family)